jgi:tetratricopeptide (TPR) repeat protein
VNAKRIILFLLACGFFETGLCYGLDWKRLHEEADTKTLDSAVSIVQAHPGAVDDLYILALEYLNVHKDNEAGDVFNKITVLDPGAVEAAWGRAEVLRRRHKLDESEKLLNEVIGVNPEFSPAYISLAYIKYIRLNFNDGVTLVGRVVRQGAAKVDRSNRVRAYLLLGGIKGTIAHYGGPISKLINGTSVLSNLKAAEALEPGSAEVKLGLGSFYLLAPSLVGGDRKKAEEYLKKAIELDPLSVNSYVRLGQVYKVRGDNAKYEACLRKAREIDPQNELAVDVSSGKCKFVCPGN